MPHVVLNGDIKIREVFENLDPVNIANKQEVLRTLKKFIDIEEHTILIEGLTIERGKKNNFLCMLNSREDGLVIRLYPTFEVEKTAGVKKILAKIAIQIIEKFPNLKIGKTNLQEFLSGKF